MQNGLPSVISSRLKILDVCYNLTSYRLELSCYLEMRAISLSIPDYLSNLQGNWSVKLNELAMGTITTPQRETP